MMLYDFKCASGHRFEAMVATSMALAPQCPNCGAGSVRTISTIKVGGRAGVPAGADSAPGSWQGTYRGNSSYIAGWQRSLDRRESLEDKYPELRADRSPVLAHEGKYESAPLTVAEVTQGGGRRHPHPHPHPSPSPPAGDSATAPAGHSPA